jgi:hypothetical protein
MATKAEKPRGGSVGKCLVCEREKVLTRGLCDTHYMQFRKAKELMTPAQLDEFEEALIDAGKLLPSRQGQREVASNPFLDMAEQLFGITAESQAAAIAESAAKNPPRKKPNK